MDAEPLWLTQKREAERKKKEAQRRAKVKDQRWHQFNAIIDTAHYRESALDTLVLVALFRRADKVGRVDMSVRQVAASSKIAPATAQRALERLRDSGVLRVIAKGTNRTPPTLLIDFCRLFQSPVSVRTEMR